MRMERQRFLKIKQAVIALQAVYRGYKVRKYISELNCKAVIIQSAFRRWNIQRKYNRKKQACISIQQQYRALVKMHMERQRFLKIKQAVIALQAVYRGYKVRRYISELNCKAVIIQSAFRRYNIQKKYNRKRQACITIQRQYQAQVKMRTCRQDFLKAKKGVVLLQAAYRGKKIRKENALHNLKAIVIQSYFKKWVNQKKFKKTKLACIILQQKYRARMKMKYEKLKYLKMKSGFIRLQALYRGFKVRKEIAKLTQNAIIIQSAFRKWRMQKRYQEVRQACIIVQQRYRAQIAMNEGRLRYLTMKRGFVQLQAIFRGSKVRKQHLKLIQNAVIIQSAFRKWIVHQKYQKIKAACIFIQKKFRAVVKMHYEKERYETMKRGFIRLQAVFRGSRVRKRCFLLIQKAIIIQTSFRRWILQKRYKKLKQSSLILQKSIRKCMARKKFLKMKEAAVKIQYYYRSYKMMCLNKKNYLKMKRGFLYLQALYRGIKVRNYYAMINHKAVIIQSNFRRWMEQKRYKRIREACIMMQQKYRANVKMLQDRQNYLRMMKGFVLLQAVFRGSKVKKHYILLRQKIVLIQSCVRKYIAQRRYNVLKRTCIKIQRQYRAKLEMRKVRNEFLCLREATVTLQAAVRCHLIRQKFKIMKLAALKLQSFTRMLIVRKKLKNFMIAVIFIQSQFRMTLNRKKFLRLRHSCIIIQSCCRRFIARKRYLKIKLAITSIQKFFVFSKLTKVQRKIFLQKKHSAVVIQSHFRTYLLRKKFLKLKSSVIKIEAFYLGYKMMISERQKYLKMIKGFTRLQALNRGLRVRRNLSMLNRKAVIIQTHFRRWIAQKHRELSASTLIQKSFRSEEHQQSYQLRLWYTQLKQSTIIFQRHARLYLHKRMKAATTIQSFVRMWIVKKEMRKYHAAKKIQAVWRGYHLRCGITDKNILKANQRIKTADSTESKKLINRTKESLDLLFYKESTTSIIIALQHLDVCTQLSSKCCESLVLSESLSILLQLLQSCNRSIPHMEIIKLTTNILLNLAKYKNTVNFLWTETLLEVVLHLMQIFREKGAEIFTKCCSLLWIFCQDPEKAKIIKKNKRITDQLCSIHFLFLRKQSQERKKLLKAPAFSDTSIISTSLCRSMNRSIRPKESQIEPDWMLGNQHRREFNDGLVAITSIIQVLDLKAK